MKRLLITGSREWLDVRKMDDALRDAYRELARADDTPENAVGHIILISGSAIGADLMAELIWSQKVAPEYIERYPAKNFGSPLKRNNYMVSLGADLCLAFPTPCLKVNCFKGTAPHRSHGTQYTIEKAIAAGIDVRIIE